MKLLLVNGFRKEYDLTLTAKKLKEEGFKVEFCEWKHPDDVKKCIEKIKPDLIIASSEAALFITDYDIPMILVQPIVDKKELNKLYPNKNLNFLPDKPSKKASFIKVLLDKEDKILDIKKIETFFEDRCVIHFAYDEKAFNVNKDILPMIIFERVEIFQIFKEKKFNFNHLIMNTFTIEELEEILHKAIAWDKTEIILVEGLNIFAYTDKIKMYNDYTQYEFKTKEEFLEAVRKIKKTNCEKMFLNL